MKWKKPMSMQSENAWIFNINTITILFVYVHLKYKKTTKRLRLIITFKRYTETTAHYSKTDDLHKNYSFFVPFALRPFLIFDSGAFGLTPL